MAIPVTLTAGTTNSPPGAATQRYEARWLTATSINWPQNIGQMLANNHQVSIDWDVDGAEPAVERKMSEIIKRCPTCQKELIWRTRMQQITSVTGKKEKADKLEDSSPEQSFVVPTFTLHQVAGKVSKPLMIPTRTCCSFECAMTYIREAILIMELEK